MTKSADRATQRAAKEKVREEVISEVRHQLAIDRFQEERPQLWLQSERMVKLVEVQAQMENDLFPEGSCFLHASTVAFNSFCVKKVIGIDLDTCQVTVEIYGDEHLEAGVVVLPLESIEWFGFPAKAVSTGIHFEGFTHHLADKPAVPAKMVKEAKGGKVAASERSAKEPSKNSKRPKGK
jgi:hypothetical protein